MYNFLNNNIQETSLRPFSAAAEEATCIHNYINHYLFKANKCKIIIFMIHNHGRYINL